MGVSGCGKTTVGSLIAEQLDIPFYDADDFHPPENVAKMKSGQPLDDADRRPWLETLAELLRKETQNKGCVLACSALKARYRNIIRTDTNVRFAYLKGSKADILKRMRARSGHYMPPELLDSQFEALEEPKDAITVSIMHLPKAITQEILNRINTDN